MNNFHIEHKSKMRPGMWPGAALGWRGAAMAVLLPVLTTALLTLSACGGGGEGGPQAGVSSGGTGSFSGGTVSAFGSIVVNGIHFDQPTAESITDADGKPMLWQDIDLGMMVEIDAGDVTKSATGLEQASTRRIRVTSDLLGPVTSLAAGEIAVMGQTVRVTPQTHLRRDGSLQTITYADIQLQDIVEVHGFQDAVSGDYIATRIEWKDPATVSRYVVRGVIKDLGARGCTIGSQRIDYVWSSTTSLRNGRVARALLYRAAYLPGMTWQAQNMTLAEPLVTDRTDAQLEGRVTERLSDKVFSINGLRVESEESCADCELGAQVSVRGELVKSVVKVRRATVVTGP